MSKDLLGELEQALLALEALVKRRAVPSRFDARRLLLALGEILLEGEQPKSEQLVARLHACTAQCAQAWQQACSDELALAATEHVQGTDARYLGHPRFDFVYAVDARRRLEMRLLAMEHLGLEASEDWLERIAQADQRLEPYLRDDQSAGSTSP